MFNFALKLEGDVLQVCATGSVVDPVHFFASGSAEVVLNIFEETFF